MKKLSLAAGVLVLAAAAALSLHAAHARQDGEQRPPMSEEEAAMFERMQELAALGEPHRQLQKMVGKWSSTYEFRWDPNGPWQSSKGTATIEPLLGGRYVMEKVQMDIPGMGPMEGVQILGYDNLKSEYVSIWMDSMSTWPVTSRGRENADGLVDMRGTMVDVMGERPFRMEIRHEGDDKAFVTMYDTMPGVGEVPVMKITSTRRK